MAEKIRFPSVQIGRINHTVYGLPHGEGLLGPSDELARALAKHDRRYSPGEYALSEEFGPDADMGAVLRRHSPKVAARIEYAEWYLPLIRGAAFKSEAHFQQLIDFAAHGRSKHIREAQAGGPSASLRSATRVPYILTHQSKRELAEEIGPLAAEGWMTFRSFLMAEVGAARAADLGRGSVRTYCGFNHTEEIESFLRDEGLRRRYVESLAPELRKVYEIVARVNRNISALFNENKAGFPEEHHPRLLGWIAAKAGTGILEGMKRGAPSPSIRIDIAEFRKLLERQTGGRGNPKRK